MVSLASGAKIIALLELIMLLSMTETEPKPDDQAAPVSGLLDLRAFASISCCRIGPPEWMNFPVDRPSVTARGVLQVAAGSRWLLQASHVMPVAVSLARMWLWTPSDPSAAIATSA